MEVIVAKTAGFCFGVERAVNKVYEQIEKTSQPIYTYGPIIHNEEVVKDLEAKGVKLIADRKELEALTEGEGVIIIRSHGVSREVCGRRSWRAPGPLRSSGHCMRTITAAVPW